MAFLKSVVAKSNTTTNKLGTNSHTLHMCCQNFTCWTYSSAVPASSTNRTSSEFTFWRHLNCVCTKVKTWHVIFIIENKFICTQYTGVQNNYVFTVQALQPISTCIGVYNQASTGSKEFQDPGAHGTCKNILSLLCKHYNLYLSLYLHTIKLQQVLRNYKIPAHGPCKIIPSLLYRDYNLYLSVQVCTIKLQQVLRNSKIPAHGPCKIILSLLCRHYNLYLFPYLNTIKQK